MLLESHCHGAAKQTVQTDELGTPVSDPEFTCNESTHDLGCVPDHAQVGREQARVLVECRVHQNLFVFQRHFARIGKHLINQQSRLKNRELAILKHCLTFIIV